MIQLFFRPFKKVLSIVVSPGRELLMSGQRGNDIKMATIGKHKQTNMAGDRIRKVRDGIS